MIRFTADFGDGEERQVGELAGHGWSIECLVKIAQAISSDSPRRNYVRVYDSADITLLTAAPAAWGHGPHEFGAFA